MLKKLLLALGLCLLPISAEAANCGVSGINACFWVGGTGSWSDTAHWANSTGGAGGFGPPTTSNTITFDGSSGGGTVTVDVNIPSSGAIGALTTSAFTGTIDFSANNNNITLASWTDAGTGTHTINMGNGTWQFGQGGGTSVINFTGANLTLVANSSTVVVSGSSGGSTTLALNGKTFSTFTIGPLSSATAGSVTITGANTFATLNLSAPVVIRPAGNTIQTITNAVNWVGTSSQPIGIISTEGGGLASTFAMSSAGGTAQWVAIQRITATTNSITATNSFDLGGNTNITITGPSGGGGGFIIGGG